MRNGAVVKCCHDFLTIPSAFHMNRNFIRAEVIFSLSLFAFSFDVDVSKRVARNQGKKLLSLMAMVKRFI
jgi:hypothetical protein